MNQSDKSSVIIYYCLFRHKLKHSCIPTSSEVHLAFSPPHSTFTNKPSGGLTCKSRAKGELQFDRSWEDNSRDKSTPLVSVVASCGSSGTSYSSIATLTVQGRWAEKQSIPWSQIYSETHVFWVLGVTTGWQLLNVSGNPSFQLSKHMWLLRLRIDVI